MPDMPLWLLFAIAVEPKVEYTSRMTQFLNQPHEVRRSVWLSAASVVAATVAFILGTVTGSAQVVPGNTGMGTGYGASGVAAAVPRVAVAPYPGQGLGGAMPINQYVQGYGSGQGGLIFVTRQTPTFVVHRVPYQFFASAGVFNSPRPLPVQPVVPNPFFAQRPPAPRTP